MNNVVLTILTVLGSAGCALTGILVNRHISLRQLKNQEAGGIITNAEYWRKEGESLKLLNEGLQRQVVEAQKNAADWERKFKEQEDRAQSAENKFYRADYERLKMERELEAITGKNRDSSIIPKKDFDVS